MNRAARLLAPLIALGIGAWADTARANLLLNPSFEEPVLAPGTFMPFRPGSTIGEGWVVQTGFVADVITNDYGRPTFPGASQGNQYLFVGDSFSATVVAQDVTLGAATPFELTFDLASGNFGVASALEVDVLRNGVAVATSLYTRPPNSGYASQTLDFTSLDAGTYTLRLSQIAGSADFVDNFQLNPVQATATPEPSTLVGGLLGGAIALGYAGRHRRRAKVAAA